MPRKRIKLEVEVDLDPSPGAFSNTASARYLVEQILNDRISHYHPQVAMLPSPVFDPLVEVVISRGLAESIVNQLAMWQEVVIKNTGRSDQNITAAIRGLQSSLVS